MTNPEFSRLDNNTYQAMNQDKEQSRIKNKTFTKLCNIYDHVYFYYLLTILI